MKYSCFLMFLFLVFQSCKKSKKPISVNQCNCTTAISDFSTIPTKTLLNKIAGKDLFLVMKRIVPSNIHPIDLSEKNKYYFDYKPGEIILRLNSDSTFTFGKQSGQWNILPDGVGVTFFNTAYCDCDTSYFFGASSLVYLKKIELFSFEHSYRNKKDSVSYDCRFYFSLDTISHNANNK